MPMIQHVYKIISCSFLKCQRPFFSPSILYDHVLTSGRCLDDWSWGFLQTNHSFTMKWMFNDRFITPSTFQHVKEEVI